MLERKYVLILLSTCISLSTVPRCPFAMHASRSTPPLRPRTRFFFVLLASTRLVQLILHSTLDRLLPPHRSTRSQACVRRPSSPVASLACCSRSHPAERTRAAIARSSSAPLQPRSNVVEHAAQDVLVDVDPRAAGVAGAHGRPERAPADERCAGTSLSHDRCADTAHGHASRARTASEGQCTQTCARITVLDSVSSELAIARGSPRWSEGRIQFRCCGTEFESTGGLDEFSW